MQAEESKEFNFDEFIEVDYNDYNEDETNEPKVLDF